MCQQIVKDEVYGDNLFEAFVAATGMPMIQSIPSGAMAGPEITLCSLAIAWNQIGCFIDLHHSGPKICGISHLLPRRWQAA